MNINDIAKKSGLSTATVSRVLNNIPSVKEENRLKVLEIVEKYHYHPNALAKSLVTNLTNTVGVMLTNILDPYYAEVVYELGMELNRYGLNMILCNEQISNEEKKNYFSTLLQYKVDGMILIGSIFQDKKFEETIVNASKFMPIVMINAEIDAPNIFSVRENDFKGSKDAYEYLYQNGSKKIAFLTGMETFSGKEKLRGYISACEKANTKSYIFIENNVSDFLLKEKPDAVITATEMLALLVLKNCKKLNIGIPSKMKLIGFNDTPITKIIEPEMTVVDTRIVDLSKIVVRVLRERFSGNEEINKSTVLDLNLILRQTT